MAMEAIRSARGAAPGKTRLVGRASLPAEAFGVRILAWTLESLPAYALPAPSLVGGEEGGGGAAPLAASRLLVEIAGRARVGPSLPGWLAPAHNRCFKPPPPPRLPGCPGLWPGGVASRPIPPIAPFLHR
ncbi:hypothetical protein FH972_021335 [Carpinus fangiana]|uniref:Uncharacterized protein n=1 Tax=Carpinus fangiana TaxID=176857 RepID=A0A5N6KP41_9ROSI|nr:hypothetical protein FH972_021335 [Carpinus fangiana]